ncbi:MAG: hypothetical protein D6785_14985 [Planctomycetota bacterium]|nr:MAG: hypothetical protein D6785_14985 [Planctomycetota bacterium]
MKVLMIAGPSSNSGKTTLASNLLKILPGKWAAIKWSHVKKENSHWIPSSCEFGILDSPEIICVPGKDTEQLYQAGASPVFWVIGSEKDYLEIWREVQHRCLLNKVDGVIIEGYSCAKVIPQKFLIFTINLEVPRQRWKKDYPALLNQAHYLHLFPREKEAEFSSHAHLPRLYWEEPDSIPSLLSALSLSS